MTTFASPRVDRDLAVLAEPGVAHHASLRDRLEALALLFGLCGTLLGLVLAVGVSPIGQ
jgi:hypothetical protein